VQEARPGLYQIALPERYDLLIDVAVALERLPTVGGVAPIGASSLLYQNSEEHWPAYAGDDLVSRYPAIVF
jgi:hypothetical protein